MDFILAWLVSKLSQLPDQSSVWSQYIESPKILFWCCRFTFLFLFMYKNLKFEIGTEVAFRSHLRHTLIHHRLANDFGNFHHQAQQNVLHVSKHCFQEQASKRQRTSNKRNHSVIYIMSLISPCLWEEVLENHELWLWINATLVLS